MSRAIDVVIVSHNTRDDLGTCLRSLDSLDRPPSDRVIVVDNASTDGSVEVLRRDWPQVDLVALGENVGFGAANNVGIRRSTAPLVLLLNADTVVPAGAIEALAARLDATGAVAAGPRLVDRAGRPEVSFGPMLSPLGEARQWIRQGLARSSGTVARRLTARLVARERVVDWVTAACCLVVRQAAVDERYFMYEEDVDLCAAMRARGGRILFTPAAEVVHARGASSRTNPGATRRHYDVSHQRYYEKHHPGWARLLALWKRVRGRAIR
jgi:hypothetical protein